MLIDRKMLTVVLVAVAIGWWLGSSNRSPLNPHPVPDRPVLSALVRVTRSLARLGLWVALAGEQTPPPEPSQQLVRAPSVDADGHRILDHREGW
jgi:hypothetical protein